MLQISNSSNSVDLMPTLVGCVYNSHSQYLLGMVLKHFGLLCGQGGDFTSVVDWLSPKMGHLFIFDTVTSFGVLDLSGMSS